MESAPDEVLARAEVSALVYLALLLLPATAGALGPSLGVPTLVAGLVPLASVAAALALLERRFPWSPSTEPQPLRVDLLHLVVTSAGVAPLVHAAAPVVLAVVASALGLAGTPGAWPQEWPLLVQVGLAALVADLGAYSVHRLFHRFEPGWRLHALHHSLTTLTFLRGARTHPLNAASLHAMELLPLLALGIGSDALVIWSLLRSTNGLLQHADVAFARSPLDRWIATAEVHRWHHSAHLDTSNHNYGNLTVVWDRLLGTYHCPALQRPSPEVGVAGLSLPPHYLAHLAVPFALPRWTTGAGALPTEQAASQLDHG